MVPAHALHDEHQVEKPATWCHDPTERVFHGQRPFLRRDSHEKWQLGRLVKDTRGDWEVMTAFGWCSQEVGCTKITSPFLPLAGGASGGEW